MSSAAAGWPCWRCLVVFLGLLLLAQSTRGAIHLPSIGGGGKASTNPFAPWLPGGIIDEDGQWKIWESFFDGIWERNKEAVSFCVGDSMHAMVSLLKRSFPVPLPTGPADDAICANQTALEMHLCTPSEMMMYMKYILMTDNVEKIPSNLNCQIGVEEPSCAPGFFSSIVWDPSAAGAIAGDVPVKRQAHQCCPGYFCPVMLTCMMPCPLGSHCPRATPQDPPKDYTADDPDISKQLLPHEDKWCAPYGYKMRQGMGCGGADKWSMWPNSAFPNMWWEGGSGNIYCDGGSYCPNTVSKLPCKEGYFCKQGSNSMTACPALADCPAGTETPSDNYAGILLDACLFAVLGILWHASSLYNRIVTRLNSKERIRVMWHKMQPQITVVRVADEASNSSGGGVSPVPDSSDGIPLKLKQQQQNGGLTRFWLGRRRSRCGSNGGPRAVWASFDAAAEGEYAPLLDYEIPDVIGAGGQGSTHRRALSRGSSNVVIQANATLVLEPMPAWPPLLGGKSRAAKQKLDIEFVSLSMRLRSCGKLVLKEVSGRLQPGRMTAIMGPSGAGKTTLMTALASKTGSSGIVTGTILINGVPDSLEKHKRIMGFVPQDDIMHRTLTVEENLMYSACFRLPCHFTQRDRLEVVANAISVLGLADVRHSIIGDEETRGISGGQRKRVNVGLELVADPSVLFLDEPTSGLDSTASKLVVQGVQRVARSGVTVAAVIHQPAYETFCMFDDLVLLAKGGLTAYYGPQEDVQAYFLSLGFEVPAHVNPADAFLDIVSGAIAPKTGRPVDVVSAWLEHQHAAGSGDGSPPAAGGEAGAPEEGGVAVMVLRSALSDSLSGAAAEQQVGPGTAAGLSISSLSAAAAEQQTARTLGGRLQKMLLIWVLSGATAIKDSATAVCDSARAVRDAVSTTFTRIRLARDALCGRPLSYNAVGSGSMRSDASCVVEMAAPTERVVPGFWRQYWWCLSRAVLMRTREPMQVVMDYAIFAITGSFLGLMSDRGRGDIGSYVGNVVYNIVALGMMATVSGIKTFGAERLVFFRESARGLDRLAYFWALETWDHAGTLLRCAVYIAMYYSFAQPRAVMWQMYVVTVAIFYCCTGTAYFLSQVMNSSAAQLTAAVFALINALVASKFGTSGLMGFLNTISYARWGLEGYVIAEANMLTGVWLLARCADLLAMHYDVTMFWTTIRVLGYIGLCFRLLASMSLVLLNRDKQL